MRNADTKDPWANGFTFGGLLLVLTGVIGYFVVVFFLAAWLPSVRNHAVPNWIIIAAGMALSVRAVVRSGSRRRVPAIVLGVNAGLAALFAAFLYLLPAMPPARGPAVGAPAPDFALADQTGATHRLADFRGGPLLLVFYRGHW
jgi:hypothetical protein